MKYVIYPALLLTAACTSACTAGTGPSEHAELREGAFSGVTKVGEPENCVRRSNIRSTDVKSDSVIDFKMRNGDIYRNVLPNSCPGLGFEEAFSYNTSINQLCSVDIIRVLRSSAGRLENGAGCGLGKFQKIGKIPGS